MIDLLTVEKEFISQHIRKGGVAADFTMGNGHDTLWLSRQVGEDGRVYAFDIQPAALEHTRALLESPPTARKTTPLSLILTQMPEST